MERMLLAIFTVVSALTPLVAPSWRFASTIGVVIVGTTGLVFNWKANSRAQRAELRAEGAERRAQEAERREQEAHAWQREQRDREQARLREQTRGQDWVADKQRAHGTANFAIDVAADLEIARAAEASGLLILTLLRGSDGSVVQAAGRVA